MKNTHREGAGSWLENALMPRTPTNTAKDEMTEPRFLRDGWFYSIGGEVHGPYITKHKAIASRNRRLFWAANKALAGWVALALLGWLSVVLLSLS